MRTNMLFAQLICFIKGHKWNNFGETPEYIDFVCIRCGARRFRMKLTISYLDKFKVLSWDDIAKKWIEESVNHIIEDDGRIWAPWHD